MVDISNTRYKTVNQSAQTYERVINICGRVDSHCINKQFCTTSQLNNVAEKLYSWTVKFPKVVRQRFSGEVADFITAYSSVPL